MKRPAAQSWIALTLAAFSASGCFSYIPGSLDTIAAGENVRVLVTPTGLAGLADLPVANEPLLRGQLGRREGDGVFLRIPITLRQEGFLSTAMGQDVLIPTREILQLERRRLNKVTTGVLIAGSAAAAGAIIVISFNVINRTQPGPGEEEEQLRFPILSFPFR